MSTTCTRCEGTGFLNLHQIADELAQFTCAELTFQFVQKFIEDHPDHDVTICDCCGDEGGWYGEPGQHYNDADPSGLGGPYEYNGGLCECN
jgi:hypothetical protein